MLQTLQQRCHSASTIEAIDLLFAEINNFYFNNNITFHLGYNLCRELTKRAKVVLGIDYPIEFPGSLFTGEFDSYTSNMQGAWSVSRRLLTSYEGALIRVRRSSDNAELDINATSSGVLDQAGLLAFVGSNSGYITKIYDQSGAGRDYGQSVALAQFRIVDSGVVESNNSVPCARAVGSSSSYMQLSAPVLTRTWLATAKLITAIDYPGLITGPSSILIIGAAGVAIRYPSSGALQMRYNGVSYAFDNTPFCYLESGCNGLVTEYDINEMFYWGSERNIAGRFFNGYIHEQIIYANNPTFLEEVEAKLMEHLSI